MGNIVEFKRPDGKTSKGYLTEGSKDAHAIVVIQEWWGMNSQIKKVADTLKEHSQEAVNILKNMGKNVVMITGDNARTGKAIADQLGIERVLAEVLPQDKAEEVKKRENDDEE